MMDAPEGTVREQEFTIRSYEVDEQRVVKFHELINHMQDAAWDNARDLGFSVYDLHQHGYTWAIARIYLEVDQLPGHGERIVVRTWPSAFEKYFVYREYTVTTPEGEDVLKATSTWLVLDMNKRKLIPVPDLLRNIPSYSKTYLPRQTEKIRIQGAFDEYSLNVLAKDQDFNHHTNNANYFAWILEGGGPGKELKSMDMIFRSETQAGNHLTVGRQEDGNQVTHYIKKGSNQEFVIQARSKWK